MSAAVDPPATSEQPPYQAPDNRLSQEIDEAVGEAIGTFGENGPARVSDLVQDEFTCPPRLSAIRVLHRVVDHLRHRLSTDPGLASSIRAQILQEMRNVLPGHTTIPVAPNNPLPALVIAIRNVRRHLVASPTIASAIIALAIRPLSHVLQPVRRATDGVQDAFVAGAAPQRALSLGPIRQHAARLGLEFSEPIRDDALFSGPIAGHFHHTRSAPHRIVRLSLPPPPPPRLQLQSYSYYSNQLILYYIRYSNDHSPGSIASFDWRRHRPDHRPFTVNWGHIRVNRRDATLLLGPYLDHLALCEIDAAVGYDFISSEVADGLWHSWLGSGVEEVELDELSDDPGDLVSSNRLEDSDATDESE